MLEWDQLAMVFPINYAAFYCKILTISYGNVSFVKCVQLCNYVVLM